jgi:antitoxin ParD1/3/4
MHRDWKMKRTLRTQVLAALQAEIDKGLADVTAGRISHFDKENIIARGK